MNGLFVIALILSNAVWAAVMTNSPLAQLGFGMNVAALVMMMVAAWGSS